MDNSYNSVYKEALIFLNTVKPDLIDDKELEKYFCVEKNYKTKNDILEHLLGSLQNYQRMPNVIKFDNNKKQFRKILLNFDCNKILKKYESYDTLLDAFSKEFNINKSTFNRKNNSWVKYSKAILSSCVFLQQFKDIDDFDSFVKLFTYNESTAAALPMLLSKEIYGLGFALACDFLKELGYDQYPKPDIHLIDVFSELGLSNRNDFDCYKSIIRMAKQVGETPYKVDKIIWLICSGNYYLHNIKIDSSKKEFIEYIKEKIV